MQRCSRSSRCLTEEKRACFVAKLTHRQSLQSATQCRSQSQMASLWHRSSLMFSSFTSCSFRSFLIVASAASARMARCVGSGAVPGGIAAREGLGVVMPVQPRNLTGRTLMRSTHRRDWCLAGKPTRHKMVAAFAERFWWYLLNRLSPMLSIALSRIRSCVARLQCHADPKAS